MDHSDKNISSSATIAKISFFIFLFFAVFGSSLPFREKVTNASDIATSNIVNQIVYSILFITSFFAISNKLNQVKLLIREEKYLSLFLMWCLISIVWSEFRFVSFKRLFQILTTVMVSLAFLLHSDSSEKSMAYFKTIFFFYITLSVLSVLLGPGVVVDYSGSYAWRGLATQKNQLGQSALVSLIIWFYSFLVEVTWRKYVAFFLLLLSLILLIGSRSTTSIMTCVILAMTSVVLFIDNRLRTIGIGRFFSFLVLISILGTIIITIFLAPELNILSPEHIGKSSTFTGRTELWSDIFEIAQNHLLIGCGFEGFWTVNNTEVLYLFQKYRFLPNQAHMGYLDILNETGLIGLLLLVLMIIFYFSKLRKTENTLCWVWIIMVVLIVNFLESTIFRPLLTGKLFVFSYLALYADIINKRQWVYE